MKGIVYNNPKVITYIDKDMPKRNSNESLIKVKTIGICGSDIHAYDGSQPMFSYPKIPGHEIGGIIVESDVFNEGDTVCVIPYYECGKCIACKSGKENACTSLNVIGVHIDGGMQEYISVPNNKIIKVDNLTFEQIAIIEPLSISEHAFSRAGANEGETIIVSGIGPIGMGIIIMAKYRKAKVIAIDMNEERLKFAKDVLGADYTVVPSHNLIDDISKITNGNMVTKIWDATGNKNSMNNIINLLAHGGTIVFVGLHNDDIVINDLQFHKRETTLMSSRAAYKKDFETVIKMIQSKFFNPELLITKSMQFNNFGSNFEEFINDNSQIKGIVQF